MPGSWMSSRIRSGRCVARQLQAGFGQFGADQLQPRLLRQHGLHQQHVDRVVLDVEHGARVPPFGRVAGARRLPASAQASCTQKRLPPPGSLSSPMRPSISSTSRLLSARPMPAPSTAPRSAPSRSKAWNRRDALRLVQPRAGVADGDAQRVAVARRRHADLAAAAVVLDGVGQQVQQHLLQPLAVGHHPAGQRPAPAHRADAPGAAAPRLRWLAGSPAAAAPGPPRPASAAAGRPRCAPGRAVR